MKTLHSLQFMLAVVAPLAAASAEPGSAHRSWTADNGNGTYTNPLLNEDFPDPDIIRVGSDFYMTGTTMANMPGLPVLRSRDLVNWTFLGYAFDRLDLGPAYALTEGREAYGKGIWAPAIRYHDGTFYIFSNVNGHGLQIFTATNPAGPWTKKALDSKTHDVSVLFDDDGKIYAVYGNDEIRLVQFKPDFSGFVEGSDQIIIPKGNGMGEGSHFYKIRGKYYIISANYAPVGRMQAGRADNPYGPYETRTISARETMGTQRGWTLNDLSSKDALPNPGDLISLRMAHENEAGPVPMHQGGIVDLPNGDWWGWSMMNSRAMGRETFLSPVTWKDGWPFFGLPGNLGRSPRTWIKPATGVHVMTTPFERDDDFSGLSLKPVWQWNHLPVAGKWRLNEKRGVLRLHTLPAEGLLRARNSLTQRVVGPRSVATVSVDAAGLKPGDFAGLALLGIPYYQLGILRNDSGLVLRFYDQLANRWIEIPTASPHVFFRVSGDYAQDQAKFSYSEDGRRFHTVGGELRLAWQLKTFQGVRYSLFAYNERGKEGGYADFDDFRLEEPLADRSHNIPFDRILNLRNLGGNSTLAMHPLGVLHKADVTVGTIAPKATRFRVWSHGQGRVALEAVDGGGFLTVFGEGLAGDVRLSPVVTPDSLFQWQDMLDGEFMLLSLRTQRYLGQDPGTGEPYSADWAGASADRKNGTVLRWEETFKGL